MKILFVIIVLALSFLNTSGQTYHKLVDTNKVWSTLGNACCPPWIYDTYFIRFTDDTLINSINYKKIEISTDSTQTLWSDYGFIYEDSSKKVHYIQQNTQTPRVIYDFSGLPGDTITINFADTMVIHNCDSVLFGTDYRKRYYLYYSEMGFDSLYCETWVEGVGSMCGILRSGTYGFTGWGTILFCFFENDSMLYHYYEFSGCYLNTVGISTQNKSEFSVLIYPNPVVDCSVLEINDLEKNDYEIEIYNSTGQMIIRNFTTNSKLLIEKKYFKSGLYLYRIIKDNRIVFSGKFEVE